MSLYIKLIDDATNQIVKPMELLRGWNGVSNQWVNPPEKKILVKIYDEQNDVWIEPDEFRADNYYFFSRRFSGRKDRSYKLYHPRYPKHDLKVMRGGSTRYVARSGSGQVISPGGNKIELRLEPHHLVNFNRHRRFIFGANLAWLDGQYDHDLGKNYLKEENKEKGYKCYLDQDRNTGEANLDEYFKRIRNDFKCRIVRFWVFEACEGLKFGEDKQIQPIDPKMISNIRTVLKIAERHRLYIYWCLLSSHPVESKKAFEKDVEIIKSAAQPRTSSFLNQTLKDFCCAIQGFSNVFAIDVMNEPEKYIKNVDDITEEDIKLYIRNSCARIKSLLGDSFLVSCSCSGYENYKKEEEIDTDDKKVDMIGKRLSNYKGLGLDFYDFHIYNDTGEFPIRSNGKLMSFDQLHEKMGLDKPCIIGEFGQHKKAWNDEFQKGIVKNFIEQAWHLGYGGCLVWNYNFKQFRKMYSSLSREDVEKKIRGNWRNALIYNNGSPRPVKDPMSSFGRYYNHYLGLHGGVTQTTSRMQSIRIWLVEYNNPFSAAPLSESSEVRIQVKRRLQAWFERVIQHSNAQSNIPSKVCPSVQVEWINMSKLSQVQNRHVVIYFSPQPTVSQSGTFTARTVETGPYRAAAQQIRDAQFRNEVLNYNRQALHGYTLLVFRGSTRLPSLSEVLVFYDQQQKIRENRVSMNADKLAVTAFHEAAHNKAFLGDDLHTIGGGGIFSETYTNQTLNNANVAFFAQYIWGWSPQYIIGQPLSPVTPP